MSDREDVRPASKVARLIEEYELQGLGAELEARWTADGEHRSSLRDLADRFNKRLLRTVLVDTPMSALDNDVEAVYRNLTGDDVNAGVQIDTRNRLENRGIDVDALERDFVTYQAIRTYLKEWRGADYDAPSGEDRQQADLTTIQRLLSRSQSVVEQRLEAGRKDDRLILDEFDVFVDARVLCRACDTQHTAREILEQGGCPCLLES